MAILFDYMGHKNAYLRIFGFEADQDNLTGTIRLKVYIGKGENEIANIEVKINKKAIIGTVFNEAVQWVEKNIDLDMESAKEIKAINESQKKSNMQLLGPGSLKQIMTEVKNRFISSRQIEMAETKIKDIFNNMFNKGNIKKAAYEYLNMLPEFKGCKNDN